MSKAIQSTHFSGAAAGRVWVRVRVPAAERGDDGARRRRLVVRQQWQPHDFIVVKYMRLFVLFFIKYLNTPE